jgi:hypothetical protein
VDDPPEEPDDSEPVRVELPPPRAELPEPVSAPDGGPFVDSVFVPASPPEAAGSAGRDSPALPSAEVARAAERSRASFFAQPEPLKTIAGADMSLVIGPPQMSHVAGPAAWMPCSTSTRLPHALQAYSWMGIASEV